MKFALLVVLSCFVAFQTQAAESFRTGNGKPLLNFDKRPGEKATEQVRENPARAALTELQLRDPGIQVHWDKTIGTPAFVFRQNGFLTQTQAEAPMEPASIKLAPP